MEKDVTLTTQPASTKELTRGLSDALLQDVRSLGSDLRRAALCLHPFKHLRHYYSKVTGRRLNVAQTWRLLRVQAAFFCTVFCVGLPLPAHLCLAGWFLYEAVKCKKEL